MTSAPQSPFCNSNPALQKAWDNTSIATLKQCPRKYQLFILEGWRTKHTAPALLFGGYFHSGIEIFEKHLAMLRKAKKIAEGQLGRELSPGVEAEMREAAIVAGVRHLLEISGERAKFSETGENNGETETVLGKFEPWVSTDTSRTRQTLVRDFVWYLEHYKSDICQTDILPDGTPAVELSFRFELPLESPDGDAFIFCGHLDKVDRLDGKRVILDKKTTGYSIGQDYQKKTNPNAQFSGYLYAGGLIFDEAIDTLIVDVAQVMVTFARFGRFIAHRTKLQLEEWLNNTLHWIEVAKGYAEKGYWPMNEESCHMYSGCQFREVCSKCPSVRQKWLESNYIKEPWNPLANRGGEEA